MTKKPSFWRPVNCARKVLPQKDDLPDSSLNIPHIFVLIQMKIASSYKQFWKIVFYIVNQTMLELLIQMKDETKEIVLSTLIIPDNDSSFIWSDSSIKSGNLGSYTLHANAQASVSVLCTACLL